MVDEERNREIKSFTEFVYIFLVERIITWPSNANGYRRLTANMRWRCRIRMNVRNSSNCIASLGGRFLARSTQLHEQCKRLVYTLWRSVNLAMYHRCQQSRIKTLGAPCQRVMGALPFPPLPSSSLPSPALPSPLPFSFLPSHPLPYLSPALS